MVVSGWAFYIRVCDCADVTGAGKGRSGELLSKDGQNLAVLGWCRPRMVQNWNELERNACTGRLVGSESA